MASHLLTANEVIALPMRPGATVRCSRGQLWLTFEPRPRSVISTDWFLSPGCDFVAPAHGTAYVSRGRGDIETAFDTDGVSRASAGQRLRRAMAQGLSILAGRVT